MNRKALLGVVLSVGISAACLLAGTGFMTPASEEELAGPHVTARSYTLPQDFVDGQWEGIIAASDGCTYFSVSSHGPTTNAQFYKYDPKADKVTHVIDVAKWCGEGEDVGKYNVQGKIHSTIFELDGKLWCTTTTAHRPPDKPGRGGHFLCYDLKTGQCKDLGLYPDAQGGLLTAYLDPVRRRLYGVSQTDDTLCYYELDTGKIVTIGSTRDAEGSAQTRMLFGDKSGCVYGGWGDGMIWRYDPAADALSCLMTQTPHDPNAPQPKKGSWHYDWRHWHPIVWDAKTQWWYGVRTNDEYLFRLRPPESPKSMRGTVEGLAPFGSLPSDKQPRFASLALTVRGDDLFYVSYRWAKFNAHLMRYHIPTGNVTDLGPILTDGNRGLTESHSLVTAPDGKLHLVGMVWSMKDSGDPNQPWAIRASSYFHARFLVIDPEKDFKN